MEMKARDELAIAFGNIVSEAGKVIMAVQAADVGARRKPDGSPVCRADLEAEQLILARLAAILPNVAVIAEESFAPDGGGPVPERFLLVDPLDGTREFLAGHRDFTVNIALIEAGQPVLGVVHLPALGTTYAGSRAGATMAAAGGPPQPITARAKPADGLIVLASRSHGSTDAVERYLVDMHIAERIAAGSSLKFCRIAEGLADLYPRFGRTMEWDTAAGHAVLAAAGGSVVTTTGEPLAYGKSGFANPDFIARGHWN
jgi:3'(2'), 5'-bisphosphate nucleotidase